ncbi:hypothetical protein P43SY_005237 [Pythium insidiosum]|uniref:ribonucleoside-triphosphate reductase (thioredoxin) n=1 Tax=Pythium insidiosum TaxID=114742 RepID=A0AAD5LF16_PYTIN|nr:hypothetical protein P43SY_005237 [Pythium insidiosum]
MVFYVPGRRYVQLSAKSRFRLNPAFVDTFREKVPPFGFNGLGELVYMRTYSRIKPDGTKERWHETVERVVNGTFTMQKHWLAQLELEWDERAMQRTAQQMYQRIFEMKFLPPGRGLWAMGSAITEERGLFAALNNCAFVSTEDLGQLPSPAEPFCFLMDAAMLGVGVGFDTKGANKLIVQGPDDSAESSKAYIYQVPDSREGWVESLEVLLNSYFLRRPKPQFDYSIIRPGGVPIKGFGGVSSGPSSLIALHEVTDKILREHVGKPLSTRGIVDIMNNIGVCVVSGNVRRTAEIAFGEYEDTEYVELKDYDKNPDRMAFGWTSNNSIFADLGMDYAPITERIVKNANHESLEDYIKTLRFAFMYAKTVTLGQTHWPRTNRVMLRNRRIGCSYDAIQAYDTEVSERFAIPRSIKTTSIKPSGTVSLLAGATPGMHYPESRFYIRRMRLDKYSELVPALKAAGYGIEPAVEAPESTLVVSIPVDVGEHIRTLSDVSAWEQMSLAAFLQRHWADNQVSSTVTFDPETEGKHLTHMLEYFQYHLKGISLLPRLALGAYPQMPYEAINESTYHELHAQLRPLQFGEGLHSESTIEDVPDKFCEACQERPIDK